MKLVACTTFLFCLLSAGIAQTSSVTPQLAASEKLQADLMKALPATTLTGDEKAKLIADADRLVANASLGAQGGSPDRMTGRAAAEEIGKMSQSGKFFSEDAARLRQDLKSLQAAAR
jgi:hypothetical protein